jgi:hypothetical protein
MPDIILVTETWWDNKATPQIDGYDLFRRDREQNKGGGGVAIYTKDTLRAYESTILNCCMSEQIWCQFKYGEEKILVGCIYRPPNAEAAACAEINAAIEEAAKAARAGAIDSFVAFGDFNFPKIKWTMEGGICANRRRQETDFLDVLNRNHIFQFVQEATFKKNTLDLILSNAPNKVDKLTIGPPIGHSKKNSLHSTVECSLIMPSAKTTSVKKLSYNYRKCKVELFNGMGLWAATTGKMISKTLMLTKLTNYS